MDRPISVMCRNNHFMNDSVDFYRAAYAGKTPLGNRLPWEIGGPQPALAAVADSRLPAAPVLDIGCGTGTNALYFAAQGYPVTGVDASPEAVERARKRSAEGDATAEFAVGDAMDLSAYRGRFGTVIDCGCFHSLPAGQRTAFARQLHLACRPGARAYILANSEEGRMQVLGRFGAHGVPEHVRALFVPLSEDDLRGAFAEGWTAESIVDAPMMGRLPGDEEPTTVSAWLATFVRE
jgi:2-polyprenyl-3-methyl-5-hydroxy-6-metoxy-1,4-benzoquinol methylase